MSKFTEIIKLKKGLVANIGIQNENKKNVDLRISFSSS